MGSALNIFNVRDNIDSLDEILFVPETNILVKLNEYTRKIELFTDQSVDNYTLTMYAALDQNYDLNNLTESLNKELYGQSITAHTMYFIGIKIQEYFNKYLA